MTPEQLAYIARRRRQIRYWPWVAPLLLLLVVLGFGWIWMALPLQLNPVGIIDAFRTGILPDTELILMAVRGSLALIACGLFLLVILLLITLAVQSEARLLAMLDELAPASPAAGGQSRQANPSDQTDETV